MKRLLFLAPLLALNACAGLPGLAPPSAQHTAVDEQALKRCEQTYKLTRTATEAMVDANLIVGIRAVQAAKLDTEAYGLLIGCRTAYRLFNTAELIRAADEMDSKSDEATKGNE